MNAGAADRSRVLVVDDDAGALMTLAALLEDEFDVVIADSIAKAISILKAVDFSVIVSDYAMPGGTGLDVLRFARERSAATFGLLWTGRADLASARSEAATFRVIPKGSDPELLLTAVRQAVALRRLRSSMDDLRRG